MKPTLINAGLLLFFCGSLQAATLTGTVSRSDTEEAVAGATLLVRGTDLSGVTGADGTYSISGIPSGYYGISCGAAGLRGQSSGAVDLQGDAQQDFSLDPPGEGQVTVSGSVLCGGTACGGAFVWARQDDDTVARTVAAADGSFQLFLSPGDYDLRAIAHRYLMEEQAGVSVNLEAPPSPAFSLTAPSHMYAIQGVVGLGDNPLDRSGSTVRLHGQAAPQSTTTDTGGSYTLTAVPAGLLSLRAEHPGYDTSVRIDVLVTGDRNLNFALAESGSGTTTDPVYVVRGVVRLQGDDGDGGITTHTESGVRVSVYSGDGSYQKSDGTNGDGRFDITGVSPGRYFLGVGHEGYLDYQGEEFALEADRWVELELEPDPDYDFGPGSDDGELGCACASSAGLPGGLLLLGLLALTLRWRRAA